MGDHSAMILELHTERLTLTPLVLTDFDLCFEMFTDPEVVEYGGGLMTKATIRKKMSDWIKRGGEGYIGIWCISDRRTGRKYGTVALLPMPIEENHNDFSLVTPGKIPGGDIEIGYFLKRSTWGRGYATEASRRLLDFVFQETPLKEVVATIDKDNAASRNVLKKLGFVDHGTMRCYGEDGPIYRITRDEWSKLQHSVFMPTAALCLML
jgi:RimJ/RimL family protein N-acetyltransferase